MSEIALKISRYLTRVFILTGNFVLIRKSLLLMGKHESALLNASAASSAVVLNSLLDGFFSCTSTPPVSLSLMVLSRRLSPSLDLRWPVTMLTHMVHNSAFLWLIRFVSPGTLKGWAKIMRGPEVWRLIDALRLMPLPTGLSSEQATAQQQQGPVELPSCSEWHPGVSCSTNAMREFFSLFIRDIPFIALASLIPIAYGVLLRRKSLPKQREWLLLLRDIVRSNAVIAALPVCVFHALCVARRLQGYTAVQRYPRPWFLHALISSAASTLLFHLESPSRRKAMQGFAHWRLSEQFLSVVLAFVSSTVFRNRVSMTPQHTRLFLAAALAGYLVYQRQVGSLNTGVLSFVVEHLFPILPNRN